MEMPNISEVILTKVNLEPGDVLFVNVTSEDMTQDSLRCLGEMLREVFSKNQVVVLSTGSDGKIELASVKNVEYVHDKCGNCPKGCSDESN